MLFLVVLWILPTFTSAFEQIAYISHCILCIITLYRSPSAHAAEQKMPRMSSNDVTLTRIIIISSSNRVYCCLDDFNNPPASSYTA